MADHTSNVSDEQLRALPPLLGIGEAAPFLGISRAGAYNLARTGELPVEVVRVGARMKIRRCDLLAFLGITANAA